MRKVNVIISIICLMTILSGCKIDITMNNESKENIDVQKPIIPESSSISDDFDNDVFSPKRTSVDGFFSLDFYIEKTEFKIGEEIKMQTILKNENENSFQIGLEDTENPVRVEIVKKGEIWGFEGTNSQLNTTINPYESISKEISFTLSELGEYQCFIFTDFSREIKDFENADTVLRNFFNDDLANTSIMIEPFYITVEEINT